MEPPANPVVNSECGTALATSISNRSIRTDIVFANNRRVDKLSTYLRLRAQGPACVAKGPRIAVVCKTV